MGYWKSKVLPKIKKVFETKNAIKKAAAAEAAKSFDDSKAEIDKEFEEKKSELEPKVLEIYESAPAEIKTLVKQRTDAGVKKNSAEVTKFLDELAKIEFPGSKVVSELATSYGPGLVPAPVLFLLEKVSTFLPAEETPAAAEPEAAAAVEETSRGADVVVAAAEEGKKEEAAPSAPVEATETTAAPVETTEAPAAPAAPAEAAKPEEAPKA
ncbi:putative salt stress root protein RS1-like [Iris pallida]|uniref:Salt stress root protein RS1-like n=1 Tax=Iris pallida TaxID=29817 RepID=A0AAX6E5X4_IRIPA|nr:putative salt stress root protein RS1-like [Iris pallida]KAJ6819505.1 putative salt stress root protein RS1-like [Iris pallida]